MALDVGAVFKIKASVDGQAHLDRLSKSITDVKGGAAGLTSTFGSLRTAFVGLGVTALAASFVSFIKNTIDAADNLGKMAQRTGIAVEELSKLQYAGELADVSLEQISVAAGKFSKVMYEAAQGGKEQQQVLRALGVDLEAVKKGQVTLTDAMGDAFEKLSAMPDGWQKNALAMQAFGKSGRELIPLFNTDIKAAARELERFGGVMTAQTTKAAEEFNDNFTRMNWATKGVIITLGNQLMPLLSAFSAKLLESKTAAGSMNDQLKTLANDSRVVEWAESGASAVAFLIDTFKLLLAVVGQVADSFKVVWEDVKFAGRVADAANPITAGINLFKTGKNPFAGLSGALEERNRIVTEANQRMAARFNQPLAGDSVKKFFEDYRAGKYDISGLKPGGNGGAVPGGGEADKAFENALKHLQQQLVTTQDLTVAQETMERIRLGHYGALTEAQKTTLVNLSAQIDLAKEDAELQKEIKKIVEDYHKTQAENQKKEAERLNTLRDRYIDLADPLEKYRKQLQEIEDLKERGLLTADQAMEARSAIEDQIDAIARLKDAGVDAYADLKAAVEGWGRSASQAFVDWAFGAKGNIRDVVSTMLKEFAQMIVYKNIFAPLSKAGGDWLSGIFGGLFGGGGSGSSAFFSHSGGTVGWAGTRRAVNPLVFAGAPRMHGGGYVGLRSDEVPTILQTGERVIPRGGNPGGVNVAVTVNMGNGGAGGDASSNSDDGLVLGRKLKDAIIGVMLDEKRPGGLLAAA